MCKASQFASASDAACELLEHVKIENFSDAEELFEALFQSAEAQYWRAFMTAMNTQYIAHFPSYIVIFLVTYWTTPPTANH